MNDSLSQTRTGSSWSKIRRNFTKQTDSTTSSKKTHLQLAWLNGKCACIIILWYCSYTVLELTKKPLYTLINVSLQHVKPSQPDPASNNIKQTGKAAGDIPEEKRNINLTQLNNKNNQKHSQRKNETRTVPSHEKSNSSVVTRKEKNSNTSSTEHWYRVTYQETEHLKNKH